MATVAETKGAHTLRPRKMHLTLRSLLIHDQCGCTTSAFRQSTVTLLSFSFFIHFAVTFPDIFAEHFIVMLFKIHTDLQSVPQYYVSTSYKYLYVKSKYRKWEKSCRDFLFFWKLMNTL